MILLWSTSTGCRTADSDRGAASFRGGRPTSWGSLAHRQRCCRYSSQGLLFVALFANRASSSAVVACTFRNARCPSGGWSSCRVFASRCRRVTLAWPAYSARTWSTREEGPEPDKPSSLTHARRWYCPPCWPALAACWCSAPWRCWCGGWLGSQQLVCGFCCIHHLASRSRWSPIRWPEAESTPQCRGSSSCPPWSGWSDLEWQSRQLIQSTFVNLPCRS